MAENAECQFCKNSFTDKDAVQLHQVASCSVIQAGDARAFDVTREFSPAHIDVNTPAIPDADTTVHVDANTPAVLDANTPEVSDASSPEISERDDAPYAVLDNTQDMINHIAGNDC